MYTTPALHSHLLSLVSFLFNPLSRRRSHTQHINVLLCTLLLYHRERLLPVIKSHVIDVCVEVWVMLHARYGEEYIFWLGVIIVAPLMSARVVYVERNIQTHHQNPVL